jgi:hypothetical protein
MLMFGQDRGLDAREWSAFWWPLIRAPDARLKRGVLGIHRARIGTAAAPDEAKDLRSSRAHWRLALAHAFRRFRASGVSRPVEN